MGLKSRQQRIWAHVNYVRRLPAEWMRLVERIYLPFLIGKRLNFIYYLQSDSIQLERLGFGSNKALQWMAFYKVLLSLALPPALPYFMSPSPHSPDLVTLAIFYQVHYLCTSCASLPCMARLKSKTSLTQFLFRGAYSALESKWGPLFIAFFIAQKSTFSSHGL